MAGMRFLTLSGTDIVSGQLHNLFPACRVGDAATIAYVQVLNAVRRIDAVYDVYRVTSS